MTQVNSPSLLAKIRPFSELSKDLNNYLAQLERVLTQLYQRTGGTSDSVVESQLDDLFDPVSDADALIEELEVSLELANVNDTLERLEELEVSVEIANVHDVFERLEELENDIQESVYLKELEPYTVATGDTAYTTAGNQFITCLNTAAAIITLSAAPDDGEEVIIWRGDNSITVNGSINGVASIVIASQYDAPHFKFSMAAGVWALI